MANDLATLQALKIDGDRLWRSIRELASVGAYRDERLGIDGVNRLALTDADAAGRRLVKRWFEEAGLTVRTDRIGNTYGRRAGREPSLQPVVSGSHIDSVPTGGAFDGALGVLGALEVVRSLNDAGVTLRRPFDAAFFTDEEGCRFGHDMCGSSVAVGRTPLDKALGFKDKHGFVLGEELARIGFAGELDPVWRTPPHAYVECHIEQGPILAAAGMDCGVVTGVQAISWWELTVIGKSAHAGTTPMRLRKDPSVLVAEIRLKMDEMARGGQYGAEARATMGRNDPHPGLVNIVPSRIVCTVDLRNPDDANMERVERDLFQFIDERAVHHGCTVEKRQTAVTKRITFSSEVQSIIAGHMERAHHKFQPILSGAGHDAQEFSSLCPTAMIFIPGEYDGISHNPREYSTPEACARGVQLLLQTVVSLAEQ